MTTVADRGRPSGSKSGQLLTARGSSGVGVPHAVVASPGCCTLTNMLRWSGVIVTPVISHPHGPTRKRRISPVRSEEHTSELQSRENLVCRLLLEKKKKTLCSNA